MRDWKKVKTGNIYQHNHTKGKSQIVWHYLLQLSLLIWVPVFLYLLSFCTLITTLITCACSHTNTKHSPLTADKFTTAEDSSHCSSEWWPRRVGFAMEDGSQRRWRDVFPFLLFRSLLVGKIELKDLLSRVYYNQSVVCFFQTLSFLVWNNV